MEREIQGKQAHDRDAKRHRLASVSVPGALIVGAGPSGLAAAACLTSRGVPSMVLERSDRIASLWQLRTYDRLRLHLPKRFCELPLLNFPKTFPSYPTKEQFVAYLQAYAHKFGVRPRFGESVSRAEFDHALGRWRVRTLETEYVARWLVVATGENAEAVVPEMEGLGGFKGRVRHTCRYRSGEEFRGQRVLVVGCGNSGMEVCLDLCNHDAHPSLVVRDSVHVLPREMLGTSTFGLSMWLLKWVPIRVVDWFLLLMSWFVFGDTARFGLNRPKLGPLRLKNLTGKTPVLDVGTLAKIKSGHVKICSGVKRLKHDTVEFVNGKSEKFDSIILATGYKSNVPYWLKGKNMFSEADGFPRKEFPEGWKGECGLYAVGFTKRGLLGTSLDAQRIARDIEVHIKENGLPCYGNGPTYGPDLEPIIRKWPKRWVWTLGIKVLQKQAITLFFLLYPNLGSDHNVLLINGGFPYLEKMLTWKNPTNFQKLFPLFSPLLM